MAIQVVEFSNGGYKIVKVKLADRFEMAMEYSIG